MRQVQKTLDPKYLSFENTSDAKVFQLNVESYTEIDFFEHELKSRQIISQLVEPLIQKANADRQSFLELEQSFQNVQRKVVLLEDVVFQRDGFDRLAVFDKIFAAIRNVDRQRVKQENEFVKKLSKYQT